MFSLYPLVKRKIKFKSLKPVIKDVKPLLDETEKWFNFLITKEGFASMWYCQGSTIINVYERNEKDEYISRKCPMIFDAVIKKEAPATDRFRFCYSITLAVSWPEYIYTEPYKQKIFVKELQMRNLLEVPEPVFSYNFNFFEITNDIPRDSISHIKRRDPDSIIRLPVSIHEDPEWKATFNKSKKVRSLNILKDEYGKFFTDMNNHLSQYNLNLQNFRDKKSPICLIQ